MYKSRGKRSRDDVERMVSIVGGGVGVDTKVAECDIEVTVGVKAGERECMVLRERRCSRVDWNGFFDVNFLHCCRSYKLVNVVAVILVILVL